MRGLYYAHSGIRYLILAFGALALVYAIVGLVRRRPYDKSMHILASSFAGMIFLQIIVGIALLISGAGRFGAAVGIHFVVMAFAAASAQLPASVMRRRPPEERTYGPHVVLTLLALALIVFGVMALGRSPLGMSNI